MCLLLVAQWTHFAMSPEKFYSLPGWFTISNIPYEIRLGYFFIFYFRCSIQRSDKWVHSPPLLENWLVDRAKTLERIKLLKEFKENQSLLMAAFLKSDQVTFEDIIKLNHTQVLVYQRFYKRVDSGLLRSDKPKIPRTEFYYD